MNWPAGNLLIMIKILIQTTHGVNINRLFMCNHIVGRDTWKPFANDKRVMGIGILEDL